MFDDEKLTGNPDEDDAEITNGLSPNVFAGSGSKLIDCDAFFTETEKFVKDLKNSNLKNIICRGLETNVGEKVSTNIKNLSIKSLTDLDFALTSILNNKI